MALRNGHRARTSVDQRFRWLSTPSISGSRLPFSSPRNHSLCRLRQQQKYHCHFVLPAWLMNGLIVNDRLISNKRNVLSEKTEIELWQMHEGRYR